VIDRLRRNPEFAASYLRAAIEDSDDPKLMLLALRRVVEARGGVSHTARLAGIKRESLHRALSSSGNPRLSTLSDVAAAVGLRLTFEPR
jgi:probable addiction module antidote protein